MSGLTSVSYPHDPRTKVPAALKAMRIWEQAWSLRRQIGFGPEAPLTVDVQTVVEKTETMSINDVLLTTCWDFTQGVSNIDGQPSLGICLYLPDVDPETAMISVNGPLIGNRHYLMRSTGLHELGHVIYDVPPGIAAYKQGLTVGNALTAHCPETPGEALIATRSVVVTRDEQATRRSAVEGALLHRFNPSAHPLNDAAREWRGLSLLEMSRALMEADGVRVKGMTRDEIATRALHAGSDFPVILASVTNRTLRAAYEAAPRTFMPFCREVTATDFKMISRVQLGEAPTLIKVDESGEITRGTIGEGKESYRIDPYSRIFAVSRNLAVSLTETANSTEQSGVSLAAWTAGILTAAAAAAVIYGGYRAVAAALQEVDDLLAGNRLSLSSEEAAAFAARLEDLSVKTGLSTTALRALSGIQTELGVSETQAAGIAQHMARALGDNSTAAKVARDAIRGLGVDLDGIKAADYPKVFEQVVAALNRYQDGPDKSAAAKAIFGIDDISVLRELKNAEPIWSGATERANAYADATVRLIATNQDDIAAIKGHLDQFSRANPYASAADRADASQTIGRESVNAQRQAALSTHLGADPEARRAAAQAELDDQAKVTDALGNQILTREDIARRQSQIDQDFRRGQIENLMATRTFAGGAEAAMRDYLDAAGNHARQSFEVVSHGLKSLEDGLVGVITGAKSLKEAFSDMALSILNDLARMAVQSQITGPLSQLLGIAGGGTTVYGTVPGSEQTRMLAAQDAGLQGGGLFSGIGDWFGSLFHEGGIAGSNVPTRAVPAALFANAPRFHKGGLASDELPAILRRGEEVLSERDPRHVSNFRPSPSPRIIIEIINQTSQPVAAKAEQPTPGSGGGMDDRTLRVILTPLMAQAIRSGELDTALRGRGLATPRQRVS